MRLGELRVHHHRSSPRSCPGEQGERLGGTGGGEHLVAGSPVTPGDGGLGGVGGGVVADVVEAVAQRLLEPERSGSGVDVHREVEQPGVAHLDVPVVPQRVSDSVGGRAVSASERVRSRPLVACVVSTIARWRSLLDHREGVHRIREPLGELGMARPSARGGTTHAGSGRRSRPARRRSIQAGTSPAAGLDVGAVELVTRDRLALAGQQRVGRSGHRRGRTASAAGSSAPSRAASRPSRRRRPTGTGRAARRTRPRSGRRPRWRRAARRAAGAFSLSPGACTSGKPPPR